MTKNARRTIGILLIVFGSIIFLLGFIPINIILIVFVFFFFTRGGEMWVHPVLLTLFIGMLIVGIVLVILGVHFLRKNR